MSKINLMVVLPLLTLSACTIFQPVRLQGTNDLKQTIKGVKLGMTKEQIAATAGATISVDPFNENRWTYWQVRSKYGKTICAQGASLEFYQNKLRQLKTMGSTCPANHVKTV